MRCLDRFNNKMKISGNSLRGEHLLDSKRIVNEVFKDDTSFTFGLYMWKHGLKDYTNERELELRLYSRKFSMANGELVNFMCEMHEPIIVGDIVYDSVHNEYLICTEVVDLNGIQYQGKFTVCNWILKWQNKDGDVFEYPCQDMNSTQYNSGETANKVMTIGTSQHMLTLPCDENTVILESPQRFYLDKSPINPTSFIVTQNDNSSYNYGTKGLVKLTVSQFVGVNDKDRPDLGLCDYIDVVGDVETPDIISELVEIGYSSTTIISGGSKKTFTAKFFDENLNEISKTPLWDIVCDFKSELEVTQSGNQITIGINNDDYIDESFKLVLYDNDDTSYSDSLIITIDSFL